MKALVFVAILIATPAALGQSRLGADLASCKPYANDGVFDTKSFLSYEWKYQRHYDSVCRGTDSTVDSRFNLASSFSLATPILGIATSGFGLSQKKQKLEQYCRTINDMSAEEKRSAFSSREFGSQMAEVAKSCLEVIRENVRANGGLLVYAEPNNSTLTEYALTIEPRPNPVSSVVEITGYDATGVQCRVNGAPITTPHRLNNMTENNFICSKPSREGTSITFHTSTMGDSPWIRLPGQDEMQILALETRLDSLASQLESLASRKIELSDCDFPTGSPYTHNASGEGGSFNNAWNALDKRLRADCPAGKVIIGVDSVHRGGYEDRQFRFKCCTIKYN